MPSLDEYLNTSYDPDVEFVDGVLCQRNVGDWLHSLVQSNLLFTLAREYSQVFAVPTLRSKTIESRYRLPDVSVLLSAPKTKYLPEAAFIAIEILSEDDRMTEVMTKLAEYEDSGVAHIWLIDPRLKTLSVYSGWNLNRVDAFQAGDIELTADEIFSSC